ncbi:MAG: hypothetical protein LV481_00140 [Methylacidiphilales bacterium]|nr:hypothetical protein [Candidatus Methylacidiphilales bacterium]
MNAEPDPATLKQTLEPWQINPWQRLLIAQVERDETWLYGEKVGHAVDAKCAGVKTKVIAVILKCAAGWRADFESLGR